MPDISVAEPTEYEAVLSLLLSQNGYEQDQTLPEQILEAHRQGEFPLEGLLKATQQGQLVGAALVSWQADGTAFVWPPAVRGAGSSRDRAGFADEPDLSRQEQPAHAGHAQRTDRAPHKEIPGAEHNEQTSNRGTADDFDDVADALLQDICRRLDEAGAQLGQCLLELGADRAQQALVRNGFCHLADLFYLQRLLDRPLPPLSSAPQFETVPFCEPENADRFADVIERTYIDTLDCPGFHGQRTGAQALASHRTSGEFAPERWKLYRIDGRDVGLLLFNDHPEQDFWELVYMGIVPEARGRGYGRAMLLSGLWEAQRAGRGAVVLAVDSKNHYANRIYSDLGFSELARRSVHLRRGRAARGT